jgi:hypothetical protein
MRFLKLLCLALALAALTGCGAERREANAPAQESAGSTSQARVASAGPQGEAKQTSVMQPVSLKQADQSQSAAEAIERKIIKDAELTLEVNSPTDAQRKVTSIAEAHSGFVVTSESKQRQTSDTAQRIIDVTLVIRVPSSQFGPAKDEILGLSDRTTLKETGQDVTEEFIDLEARIKTQKALEAQFLEIMKQAHKVEDALEVQRQIADVRTEIEKLEGRKRFLENRSSLSTITVNLQSPVTMVVTTTGFGREIKVAAKESIDVAAGIVLFLIRFVIVMIPIFILIILPVGLVVRYLLRRAKRIQAARPLTPGAPPPAQATETPLT